MPPPQVVGRCQSAAVPQNGEIASGAGGIALALGVTTTAATLPVTVCVAVGGVVVATLNVLIYQQTGGASPVEEFRASATWQNEASFVIV